ncbi:Glycosyltransferase involved in cell wall bisynthesis [Paramicrobacterium humi]|uniref:D-inositol 3-phosphate glycosyltransferase n=1 Tax=Paramicrobacterium humi TaxID=640635 RepID=A0A1H4IS22_9MICO|nr:glycosyltransferase family 4 protein [Microbacterium humi]SEB36849.1 Glycosyltransferase involved in cell wall bisynthesis [Microbacterium humi]
MRIILASRIFAPEPGAASLRLRAFVNAAARNGHEVTVLTSTAPPGQTSSSAAVHPGVRVRRAPVLRDRAGYVRGYLQYLSFDVPLAVRLLFARRPSAVVVEPPPTTGAVVRVICALRRLPYFYYAADVWSDASAMAGAPAFIVRTVRWLEKFAIRGATRALSVSEGVTERLAELGIRNSVATVGNGVDLGDFTPEGDGTETDGPYVVYTGTASEVHGARIFAEAFRSVHARLPGAILVFIGQGSERAEIERLAATLPVGTIRFLSRREPHEIARWLRGASAALASVKPGGGYDFAFPTKLYAAAACGTPMIYAGVGPGRTFVGEVEGGVAVEYDVDAIAQALEHALRQPRNAEARARTAAWAHLNIDIDAVARRAILETEAAARTDR